MKELQCPNCKKVFQVDEADYAQILSQVKNAQFEQEVHERLEAERQKADAQMKVKRMEQEKLHAEQISIKKSELEQKNLMIEQLKAQLDKAQTEKELAITKATQEKENEIVRLKSDIELQKQKDENEKLTLIEQHKGQLRLRDEEIDRLKDFKAKQSTKMVGESLEQHCLNQFNGIRMAAFPNAEFGKDNEVSGSGSKGDFIYRESSDGVEFISIMFEMKNEMDTTSTKRKNEDFFKELDKDRREKGCEYAVLVSLLEADNDFYNNGIADVSYVYPKMFVVRPQFFIPIISLLRNAALNSLTYRTQLEQIKNQQLDIVHFEENLTAAKEDFSKSVSTAASNYDKAIADIDAAITKLEKTKTELMTSMKFLNAADNKLDKVTIKKLTKNAPSVKKLFDDMNSGERPSLSEDTSS
ncbi:MAG: DUF2130 domain-containing protein [Clostridiales bacterium]|nr:DUF2130 domain-containing protein [Clostridiales bacterium]